jgi:hypothetical protein
MRLTPTLALASLLVVGAAPVAQAGPPQPPPRGAAPPEAPPPPPPIGSVLSGPAPWVLPGDGERRATIVTGLPVALPYRICNDSNTAAVVVTDDRWEGFDLPGGTCVDVAARNITIRQRVAGIPPRGSYLRLY